MTSEIDTTDDETGKIGKIGVRVAHKILNDLAIGTNLDVICKTHGITKRDVGEIITSKAGRDYLNKTKGYNDLTLDGRMTKALLDASEKLLDRIEHGDIMLLKGKLVRVPLIAKDLAFCISVLFDKRKQIREVDTTSEISDGLALIAQKLEQLGGHVTIDSKPIEPKVIEDAEILPSQVPASQSQILLKYNALQNDLAGKGRATRTDEAVSKYLIVKDI